MNDFNSWLYILSPMQMTQHCWMLHVASVCTPCCMLLGVVAQSLKPVIAMCKQTFDRLPLALASLNYEKADLLGVMNSNRKFDVSLDGTVSSHKNKSHAQCLCFNSRCKNLSSQDSKREKMLISGRHL